MTMFVFTVSANKLFTINPITSHMDISLSVCPFHISCVANKLYSGANRCAQMARRVSFGFSRHHCLVYRVCLPQVLISPVLRTHRRYRAYRDTVEGGMTRFRLPIVGELAERWVADE
jgi:hypothetical protein